MSRRVYLRQVVRVDVAHTDLPVPIGGGRWGFLRTQTHRIQLTPDGHAFLAPADLVLAFDRQGPQQGIAYGNETLLRIMQTDEAAGMEGETVCVVGIVLDGSAKKIGRGDTDMELLVAACLVAKGEELDDEGNVRSAPCSS